MFSIPVEICPWPVLSQKVRGTYMDSLYGNFVPAIQSIYLAQTPLSSICCGFAVQLVYNKSAVNGSKWSLGVRKIPKRPVGPQVNAWLQWWIYRGGGAGSALPSLGEQPASV